MTKFILIGLPRTGSSLLRELLVQHPDIQVFNEIFHPFADQREAHHSIEVGDSSEFYQDENEDAFVFLDRLVWNEANFGAAKAIGFKLFARYIQAEGTARLFARLKEEHGDIKIIHLVRPNLLDMWISAELAEISGVWRISTHHDRAEFDAPYSFKTDQWKLKDFLQFSTLMVDFFRRHFGPGQYLEVNYESLSNQTDSTLLSVFNFLGVAPMLVQTPLQKQNLRKPWETVGNYDELRVFFSNTEYAQYFPPAPAEGAEGAAAAEATPAGTSDQGSAPTLNDFLPTRCTDIESAAKNLSVYRWLDEVGQSLESSERRFLFEVPMPTAPTADLQRGFVGSAGRQTILEAGVFYRYVHDVLQRQGVSKIGRLLDFGCGWGRMTRLFLRDVPQQGLFGIDPNYWGIEACRAHVPQACFIQSDVLPPTPFRDQFFDVVVAYSVFSHLTEFTAYAWITEIARLLRPGGLLIATTHPVWMLDMAERLRTGAEPIASDWHANLAKSWMDVNAAKQHYEAGGFLFAETGEQADGYGDVVVSPGYVNRVWGKLLEPVEFVSDAGTLPEAVFVMRKKV